jgi:hypothetical protein
MHSSSSRSAWLCGHVELASLASWLVNNTLAVVAQNPIPTAILLRLCVARHPAPSAVTTVFTSSVGKETTVAVALLCVWPIIIEVSTKNRTICGAHTVADSTLDCSHNRQCRQAL